MKLIEIKEKEVEVVVGIVCDVCKKVYLNDTGALISLSGWWGYYSNKDGDHWECDICSDCADKLKVYIESLGGEIRITGYGELYHA